MAGAKRHSPEVKAQVIAALLAGQGVSEVATTYKLDKSVVSRWRAKINADDLQRIATKKSDEFTELIAEALRSILKTLRFSADTIRSEQGWAWIKQNGPAEFATLVGVLTDKGFRLLEAAEYSSEAGNSEPGQLETAPGPTEPGAGQ
jgi:transposase-like protein